MIRHERTGHPHEGLTSHNTLGFVPTELLLLRSNTLEKTWTGPVPLKPPLVGPSFEMCCPITVLRDGRLLATAWTYDNIAKADRPNQYAISTNGGRNWSAPATTGLIGQTLTPLVPVTHGIVNEYSG